jgi:predicted aspartyl protease
MPNQFRIVLLMVFLSFSGLAVAKGPFNLDILRRDGYGSAQLFLLRDNQFSVPVMVNGQKVRLILDTGYGGGIGLDKRMANVKIATEAKGVSGYGLSGKAIEAHRGTAQTVALGNVQLTAVPVEVGEFTALSQGHADTFSTRWDFDMNMGSQASGEGFMGRNFLHTNHAVIDVANRTLYLRPPGTGRAAQLGGALTKAGMGEAAITNGNMVDVEVNGVAAKMVVDTGAFVSLIDPRFAARAKVSGGWSVEGMELNDIANVKSRAGFTGLSNLKIGGIPARGGTVTVVKLSEYSASGGKVVGLLGLDYLGRNWSVIDFGQNKLYFAKGN